MVSWQFQSKCRISIVHERFKWNTSELRVTQLVDTISNNLWHICYQDFILSFCQCGIEDVSDVWQLTEGWKGTSAYFLVNIFQKKNNIEMKKEMAVAHLLHPRSVNMLDLLHCITLKEHQRIREVARVSEVSDWVFTMVAMTIVIDGGLWEKYLEAYINKE